MPSFQGLLMVATEKPSYLTTLIWVAYLKATVSPTACNEEVFFPPPQATSNTARIIILMYFINTQLGLFYNLNIIDTNVSRSIEAPIASTRTRELKTELCYLTQLAQVTIFPLLNIITILGQINVNFCS